MNIAEYFVKGLRNTLRLKSDKHFSFSGNWQLINENTILDEFHIGDFVAAEYTIIVDAGNLAREIIKCTVVAGVNTANVSVYSRVNLGKNLVDIDATVNLSKVLLRLSPVTGSSHKCYYSAKYFQTLNQLGEL